MIRRILFPALVAFAQPAAAADLSWLAGHWCNEAGEELWLPERGGLMLGLSRSQYGEQTHFEFLRIELDASGARYIAQPGGRAPTSFALGAFATHSVEFLNPQHDFPRRIRYWLGEERLHAAIDDGEGGQEMTFAWSPCARD